MKRKSSPWLSHSPRKRQSVPSNPSQEKKPVTQSTQNSTPCLSIHQQAEPYRLTTVRFPIDALSARWGKGKNRPIDEHHKHELHESFRTQGLLRTDSKNWLRIACAKGDVDRMEAALQAGKGPGDKQEGTESETASWPSYMRWREVNAEVQVELIAGNHRVAALKDYLQDEPAAVDERWWICEVYDRDTLPLALSIGLRANREDMLLPDTHGHIWMELNTLYQTDPELWNKSSREFEQTVAGILGLNGRVSFPVRRLGILWRNAAWRDIITEWCSYPVGQQTFNISVWEWMASLHIDEYWLAVIRRALATMKELRERFGVEFSSRDWIALADLEHPFTETRLRGVFYPSQSETDPERIQEGSRSTGFLGTVDDVVYRQVYHHLLDRCDLGFPSVHTFLKVNRSEGKAMTSVLTHVASWFGKQGPDTSIGIGVRAQLHSAFLHLFASEPVDEATRRAIRFQQTVLEFARAHIPELNASSTSQYLVQTLETHPDTYCERFTYPPWRQLLITVRDAVGPQFTHARLTQFNDSSFSLQDPTTARITVATLPQAFATYTQEMACVTQNPALREGQAIQTLNQRLADTFIIWASDVCVRALANPKWSGPEIEIIKGDCERYQCFNSSQHTPTVAKVQELLNGESRDGPESRQCSPPAQAQAQAQDDQTINVDRPAERPLMAQSQNRGPSGTRLQQTPTTVDTTAQAQPNTVDLSRSTVGVVPVVSQDGSGRGILTQRDSDSSSSGNGRVTPTETSVSDVEINPRTPKTNTRRPDGRYSHRQSKWAGGYVVSVGSQGRGLVRKRDRCPKV